MNTFVALCSDLIVLAFVTVAFIEGERRVFQLTSWPCITAPVLSFIFDTTKILMIKFLEYFFMKSQSQ